MHVTLFDRSAPSPQCKPLPYVDTEHSQADYGCRFPGTFHVIPDQFGLFSSFARIHSSAVPFSSQPMVVSISISLDSVNTTRALALMAKHPEAAFARAEMDTYWISARGLVLPAQMQYAVWLMDPHRCEW